MKTSFFFIAVVTTICRVVVTVYGISGTNLIEQGLRVWVGDGEGEGLREGSIP